MGWHGDLAYPGAPEVHTGTIFKEWEAQELFDQNN
jgi:hypothetical protein